MPLLTRLVRWINLALVLLASFFVVLMMTHITLEVAVRFIINGRIVGTLEVVSFYYMVGVVFLALGWVELKGEHIRVDLFAQLMPRGIQLGLYVFACLAGLVFFGMLFWQTLLDAIAATRSGEEAMSNFTFIIWPARWALPIGFAGIVVAVLSNLLNALGRREAL